MSSPKILSISTWNLSLIKTVRYSTCSKFQKGTHKLVHISDFQKNAAQIKMALQSTFSSEKKKQSNYTRSEDYIIIKEVLSTKAHRIPSLVEECLKNWRYVLTQSIDEEKQKLYRRVRQRRASKGKLMQSNWTLQLTEVETTQLFLRLPRKGAWNQVLKSLVFAIMKTKKTLSWKMPKLFKNCIESRIKHETSREKNQNSVWCLLWWRNWTMQTEKRKKKRKNNGNHSGILKGKSLRKSVLSAEKSWKWCWMHLLSWRRNDIMLYCSSILWYTY